MNNIDKYLSLGESPDTDKAIIWWLGLSNIEQGKIMDKHDVAPMPFRRVNEQGVLENVVSYSICLPISGWTTLVSPFNKAIRNIHNRTFYEKT